MVGNGLARRALRGAAAAGESGIRGGGDPVAGAGYWRQYGDISVAGCGTAALAAGEGSAAAGVRAHPRSAWLGPLPRILFVAHQSAVGTDPGTAEKFFVHRRIRRRPVEPGARRRSA